MKLSGEGIASKKELPLDQISFSAFFGAFYSGFGYIYAIPQNNTNTTAGTLNPSLNVYVRFFKPEINKFTKPFIIYQTIANVSVMDVSCTPDFIRVEFKCLLFLQRNTSTSYNFMLISFLSSGSIISAEEIQTDDANSKKFPIFLNLLYGGYLFIYINPLDNGSCVLGGQILDNNNVFYSKWNFPSSIMPSPCFIIQDSSENKVYVVSEFSLNSITIITSNLPKFINDGKVIIYLFIYF